MSFFPVCIKRCHAQCPSFSHVFNVWIKMASTSGSNLVMELLRNRPRCPAESGGVAPSVPTVHAETVSKTTWYRRSPRNWLKIVKNPMGYPWDWFKSPFPWVSHGTDLSHQNPWDTHGSILSHYSWLKLLWWMHTMHGITMGPF